MMSIDIMTKYLVRILPGMALAAAYFALVPRKIHLLRLTGYIFLFIFIRDAMTPAGLWSFGTEGFFWIRFIQDPLILSLFGLSSAVIVIVMNRIDPDLKKLIVWFKGNYSAGVLAGVAGALLAAGPLVMVYACTPMTPRGGDFPPYLLIPLLLMTMLGNLYEETIFRGYFQGFLESTGLVKPLHAALLSGVMFGFGHIFLALTVTNVGYSLLLFALYEGIIASLVRMRYGVIPATVTHGGAIFILASGLV